MVGNLPDPAILRIPLGRSQKGSKNGTPRGLRLEAGPEIEGGVKALRGGKSAKGGGKSAWNSTDGNSIGTVVYSVRYREVYFKDVSIFKNL